MNKDTKLIILRGNSGSGKSTTAKELQKKFGHGTMLIPQDIVRREMLFVKDGPDNEAVQLLIDLVLYGKKHCDIIILEGILNATWYRKLFETILEEFDDKVFAYYFDIPFEETLNRHKQKPNANEFGEKEMKRWWKEKDLLGIIPEADIHKELSLEETVELIYKDVLR
ncbi:kinase [Clostridium manihotivorum]|uniref:Uridine kinase n=1 Tax=Clostridium manihotivorum TaxID=2320868 RepID=A0A3R5U5L1_9CLOT|nr:kinase [Clostridium manihotivorum]QAA32328.1 uridine kinase [Clostridium manihotivorum]